jgi:hypothetical protein
MNPALALRNLVAEAQQINVHPRPGYYQQQQDKTNPPEQHKHGGAAKKD